MVNKKTYDFSGWATRNDIQCSDGRTIKQNAFKDQDGQTVPLVWNHGHSEVGNVLGHALLENRETGVYCYCSFNNTPSGQEAKELVQHGDISSLSIFANRLKQNGKDVIHGMIREVSLVLAGANPGAFIENIVAHDDAEGESAQIYHTAEGFEFPNDDEQVEEQVKHAEEQVEEQVKHAEEQKKDEVNDEEETVAEVFDTLTEKQKKVVYYMLGKIAEDTTTDENQKENIKEDVKHADEQNEEDKTAMKENIFDKTNNVQNEENYFTHSELNDMVKEAHRAGSLKDVVMSHMESDKKTLSHSITDISNLMPETSPVYKEPKLIKRNQEWVSKVLDALNKVPFAKIKNTAIDVTADAARAKGYVTGSQKVEEVVAAIKRTTDPTTIYKLQKLDRDYVIDITDFDVVSYMKSELNVMLDEELARAILIGDGRSAESNDKINPLSIRPILGDNDVYTVKRDLTRADDATDESFAKDWIKNVIKARKLYKGSGKPTMFMTEDLLADCLCIESTDGKSIYENEEQLAKKLRVKEIVTVPVFDNVVRSTETHTYTLMAMMVNLNDYTTGNNKGGVKSFFEDFNLDFNKYEYLLETRKSGALTVPYSAITWEEKAAVVQPEAQG